LLKDIAPTNIQSQLLKSKTPEILMNDKLSRTLIVVSVILALGMSAGAYLLGFQARHIGSGKQTIAVKGLAEKQVKADVAEWTVGTHVTGATFAEALKNLRNAQPALKKFLADQGFSSGYEESSESVRPHMDEQMDKEGRYRSVQKGFEASQSYVVQSKELEKIVAAYKAIIQFEADGNAVSYSSPQFMVSNLEDVKMSLIGAATKNAQQRAEEFAKNGNTKVGAMRYASQGAFYILAPNSSDVGDYGGTYDKTTIDKIARVVVTIEYAIE
jgi:uncharacterized protein